VRFVSRFYHVPRCIRDRAELQPKGEGHPKQVELCTKNPNGSTLMDNGFLRIDFAIS
jgi:hypothetical protein